MTGPLPLVFVPRGEGSLESIGGLYSVSIFPPVEIRPDIWRASAYLRPTAGERLAVTLGDYQATSRAVAEELARSRCDSHARARFAHHYPTTEGTTA